MNRSSTNTCPQVRAHSGSHTRGPRAALAYRLAHDSREGSAIQPIYTLYIRLYVSQEKLIGLALFLLLAFVSSSQLDTLAFRYRTPGKSDPLLVKAKTLLAHEDIEEALEEFQKLIKQEPKNFEGYLGAAECLYFKSEYLKALALVNTALSLNPKSADAHRRRGKINEKLHQDDAALEDYTRAINNSPNEAMFLSDRSDIYKKKGDYEKAVADLSKYLKLVKKPNPMIYYSRSLLYTKLGKKAEAEADRQRGDLIINGTY